MTDKEIASQEETIFDLLRTSQKATMEELKENCTGPLVNYSLKLISTGDLKRCDQVLKLLDLIHKHSTKEIIPKEDKTYSTFLEGLKN